ncbi:hypothetical protein Bhyg_12518 [Pseudolycoriella hygida]|uniref:MD-2-related lipid-recognition domain-containing protein n=1 Tax=Pseudolycoriella hygida TaxID=35572 RepID=A0A9Q0MXF1_9DIPT|nr:hypothetical protein Bhyg_12518 [Pseudolycoriella hygida]
MKVLLNVALILVSTTFLTEGIRRNLALESVVLRTEKCVCDINPRYGNSTCSTKVKSRNVTNVNASFTLIRKVEDLTYNAKTFYQFSNNEYRPMLIDVTMNFCANEKGIPSSPLHAVMRAIINDYTNFYDSCPFLPGKLYYVKDWNFVASDLPSVVPAGRYMLNFTFFCDRGQYCGNFGVYFRVDNHGILELNVG